jgi:hypothetical protein
MFQLIVLDWLWLSCCTGMGITSQGWSMLRHGSSRTSGGGLSMKAHVILLFAVLFSAGMVLADEPDRSAGLFKNATIEQTEKSIIAALESDSPGRQVGAALAVRELKALMPKRSFSCFVIPLMRVMKTESAHSCSRVVAAIALADLHSERGDFAISRQAHFTGCDKLARACNWLTFYQYAEDHPEIAPREFASARIPDDLWQK